MEFLENLKQNRKIKPVLIGASVLGFISLICSSMLTSTYDSRKTFCMGMIITSVMIFLLSMYGAYISTNKYGMILFGILACVQIGIIYVYKRIREYFGMRRPTRKDLNNSKTYQKIGMFLSIFGFILCIAVLGLIIKDEKDNRSPRSVKSPYKHKNYPPHKVTFHEGEDTEGEEIDFDNPPDEDDDYAIDRSTQRDRNNARKLYENKGNRGDYEETEDESPEVKFTDFDFDEGREHDDVADYSEERTLDKHDNRFKVLNRHQRMARNVLSEYPEVNRKLTKERRDELLGNDPSNPEIDDIGLMDDEDSRILASAKNNKESRSVEKKNQELEQYETYLKSHLSAGDSNILRRSKALGKSYKDIDGMHIDQFDYHQKKKDRKPKIQIPDTPRVEELARTSGRNSGGTSGRNSSGGYRRLPISQPNSGNDEFKDGYEDQRQWPDYLADVSERGENSGSKDTNRSGKKSSKKEDSLKRESLSSLSGSSGRRFSKAKIGSRSRSSSRNSGESGSKRSSKSKSTNSQE